MSESTNNIQQGNDFGRLKPKKKIKFIAKLNTNMNDIAWAMVLSSLKYLYF
jgi:hypothetical protein